MPSCSGEPDSTSTLHQYNQHQVAPEFLEQLLSSKQMTLSKPERSLHSRVKSQSVQSIPRRGSPYPGPLAGIYGWGLAPILLLNNGCGVKEARVGGDSKIESSFKPRWGCLLYEPRKHK